MSRLYTSNISQRYDNALSPYLFQCYCGHRTFQAILAFDKIAAEPTGLSFTPQFLRALWPLKNLTELADGLTLCVRRQRRCNWVASSASPPSQSLCTRLSVRLSSSRFKISRAKSKQITHSRQIKSCSLIYLETIALSELANCMTAISWPPTCITSRLLLMH